MDPRYTVAVRRCPGYEPATVRRAVRDALSSLPTLSECLRPGTTVLLKPNIVSPRGPDRPVCTHPAVVRAVAEVAADAGCQVIVADQPTYLFAGRPEEALRPAGYHEALDGLQAGVFLLARDGYEPVTVEAPLRLGTVHVARLARQVDAVINLPKCKTHVQTTLTLAVKNMFGAIAPRDRMRVHARGTYEELSAALADCFSAVVPQFNLLDAVVAMEGPGPTRGLARTVGAIAASTNAVALDLVAEELAGMAGQVGATRAAARRGLGPALLEEVRVVGDDPADLRTRLSPPPRTFRSFPPFLGRLGERLIYNRPHVDPKTCLACGGCAESCPVRAISLDGHAVIDRRRCIECFCCMEACPADAIDIERSFLSRFVR